MAAARCLAGHRRIVSQKPALRHGSALQVTTFGCVVGAVACLPFSGQLVSQAAKAPLSATLGVCYLGVFPTAVAFTTWAYALARTPAGKKGATTYLVPAITVLMSWATLGELPGWLVFAGGALCLAGVAISRRGRARPAPSPATWPPQSRARSPSLDQPRELSRPPNHAAGERW